MIEIFRKIWKFAGKEQKNIRNSIILGFINAIFHMLQIGAIFLTIQALVKKEAEVKTIWYILALMLISIIGKIVTNYFSQLQQTHAGYFMAANKRVFIGNKMKVIPMGFSIKAALEILLVYVQQFLEM